MTSEEFAELFRRERDAICASYSKAEPTTEVGALLESLKLSAESRDVVNRAIRTVVTDTLYSVLLALDGAASLGDVQERYTILGPDGEPLDGDLESAAYDALQSE
jgi:enolase